MCGMCGLLGSGNHWSNTIPPGTGTNTRRQGLIHVALANRVLASYRLRLYDFHGQSFVLSSQTATGANTRRQRLIHVPLANRVIGSYRLRLYDFHGQSFVLSSPTGTSELV